VIVDGRGFTIYESAAELRMVGSLGPVCVSAMGRGGEGRRRRAVVGTALRTPLRSITRQARRSAASSGHLLWSRPKVSRALPTERPYVMRGAPLGRRAGAGAPPSTIASDEHVRGSRE
jgi:hypothetical protein